MDLKNLPDISQMLEGEGDLNPFAFDASKYATPDLVSNYINKRRKATKIDLNDLLVPGAGIARKDSFEEYLSDRANSSSSLKQLLITPRHYQVYKEEMLPKKTASHFEFGTFCHQAFLEPKMFKRVIKETSFSRTTTADQTAALNFYRSFFNKRQSKEFTKICMDYGIPFESQKLPDLKQAVDIARAITGKTFLDIDSYQKIQLIEENYNAYGNGLIPKLLKGAAFETSFYTVDKETGIDVKVRPDAFNIEENIGVNAVISFKTSNANSLKNFWHDSAKYAYEVSESMYIKVLSDMTGRNFNTVITIMIQSNAPFLPAVFWWSAEDLNLGLLKYKNSLKMLKLFKSKNLKHWPGYDYLSKTGIIAANLPSSAYNGFKTFEDNE